MGYTMIKLLVIIGILGLPVPSNSAANANNDPCVGILNEMEEMGKELEGCKFGQDSKDAELAKLEKELDAAKGQAKAAQEMCKEESAENEKLAGELNKAKEKAKKDSESLAFTIQLFKRRNQLVIEYLTEIIELRDKVIECESRED